MIGSILNRRIIDDVYSLLRAEIHGRTHLFITVGPRRGVDRAIEYDRCYVDGQFKSVGIAMRHHRRQPDRFPVSRRLKRKRILLEIERHSGTHIPIAGIERISGESDLGHIGVLLVIFPPRRNVIIESHCLPRSQTGKILHLEFRLTKRICRPCD